MFQQILNTLRAFFTGESESGKRKVFGLAQLRVIVGMLIGILVGVVVAIPVLWVGLRQGVVNLREDALGRAVSVESNLQAMADLTLDFEKTLHKLGWTADDKIFREIEERRSLLAGAGSWEEKLEYLQSLERAILKAEKAINNAGRADPKVGRSVWLKKFRKEHFEVIKRDLVKTEDELLDSVKLYNSALAWQPVSWLDLTFVFAHRSFFSWLTEQKLGPLEELRRKGIEARKSKEGKVIASLKENMVRFDFAKTALKQDSRKVLDQVMEILKRYPQYTVEIIGHTDNIGGDRANMRLSLARATRVKEYLESKGFDPAAILEVGGRGERQPLAGNDTDSGRFQNRRVELILTHGKKASRTAKEQGQAAEEEQEVELYFQALPLPVFLAEAPKPEGDYAEIQYDQEAPSMLNLNAGQEAPVLLNRDAAPAFQPTEKKKQTKIRY